MNHSTQLGFAALEETAAREEHQRLIDRWPRPCEECGGRIRKRAHRHWCSLKCRRAALKKRTAGRFWRRVNKTEACWLWTGHTADGRYGWFWFEGRGQVAHRVAWKLERGPIPDGLQVCHRCDVTKCVRPDHLFLGTQTDNNRDCLAKGRGNRRTHRSLTPEQVRAIRAFRREGLLHHDIALRFGVSRSLVGQILNGLIYRDIP